MEQLRQSHWATMTDRDAQRRMDVVDYRRRELDDMAKYCTKKQREVIERCLWQGETFEECAQSLGISKQAVLNRINGARKKLANIEQMVNRQVERMNKSIAECAARRLYAPKG